MRRGLAGSIVLALGICGLVFAQAVRTGGGSSLPSQTSNSGKYLTTNGTTASWGTVTVGTSATYVSSAGANTMGFALGDGGMFCYNGDCTARAQVDGGISGVTAIDGLFFNAPFLDSSGNNGFAYNASKADGTACSSGNLFNYYNAGTTKVSATCGGNVVSSAATDTAALTIPGETQLCLNGSPCTNFEETDGGTATVNMITGVYRKAQVLDNSSSNAAFVTNGVTPAGTGVGTAAIEKWYYGTGLAFGIYAGGVVANWGQMNGNAGASIQADSLTGSSNTLVLKGNKDDAATAIAVVLGGAAGYSTVGSQSLSLRNGPTTEYGYVLPTGLGSAWTQHPVTGSGKRLGEYTITLNSDTTFTATKLPAPTLQTAGAVASSPTVDGTLNMIDYPTTSSSGNASGINGPYTVTRFDFRPRLTAVVRTGGTITNLNVFVCLSDGDISAATTLANLNSHRAVCATYTTTGIGGSSTQWCLVTSDGTTASASCTSLAVAVSTTYVVDLDVSRAGGAVMRINNSAIGGTGYQLKTTNIPTGATDVGIQIGATTQNAAAKDFLIGKVALEQN